MFFIRFFLHFMTRIQIFKNQSDSGMLCRKIYSIQIWHKSEFLNIKMVIQNKKSDRKFQKSQIGTDTSDRMDGKSNVLEFQKVVASRY